MHRDQPKPAVIRGAAVTGEKRDLARQMRQHPTPTEALAWDLVRSQRCLGLKFRRQQVIRGFIVDLYCAELRLAIELDGAVHDTTTDYDTARTQTLASAGIHVIRIRNEDLTLDYLISQIQPLLSTPSPDRERGPGGEVSPGAAK